MLHVLYSGGMAAALVVMIMWLNLAHEQEFESYGVEGARTHTPPPPHPGP